MTDDVGDNMMLGFLPEFEELLEETRIARANPEDEEAADRIAQHITQLDGYQVRCLLAVAIASILTIEEETLAVRGPALN